MDFESQTQENYKEENVNGMTYVIQRFSPTPALKLSSRLAKFLGPAIAQAVSDFQTAGGDRKKMTAKDLNFAKIISALLPNLDEDLVANTMKDLLSCTSHENVELKGQKYEEHFKSHGKNLLPLVAKVVEYQFSDFLSGLLTVK